MRETLSGVRINEIQYRSTSLNLMAASCTLYYECSLICLTDPLLDTIKVIIIVIR